MLIFNPLTNYSQDDIDSDLLDSTYFTNYFDDCLAYIDSDNYLAVRSLSPCTKSVPNTATPGAISTDITHLGTFLETEWTSTDSYGGVYGIAKDGHLIFGPYNANGELWSCDDVDFCNGFFLTDTSYGYATTTFFPYTVGCWGPADGQLSSFTPSCSTNACGSAIAGLSLNLIAVCLMYLCLTIQ